jgi:V8-like Glu-specific endopeptidase
MRFDLALVGSALIALSVLAASPAAAQTRAGTSPAICAAIKAFGLARFSSTQKLLAECAAQPGFGAKSALPTNELPTAAPKHPFPQIVPRSIYIRDDRREASDLRGLNEQKLPFLQKAVRATAAIVMHRNLQTRTGGFRLALSPFRPDEASPLCPGEAFATQKVGAMCTAFLIAPNLIATAGHCMDPGDIPSEAEPSHNAKAVVFGFQMAGALEKQDFRSDQVYEMRRIVAQANLDKQEDPTLDFAVIELTASVPATIAEPLQLGERAGLSVHAGTKVGVIGYPDGLPEKVSFDGFSRALEEGTPSRFSGQMNTFHGNSGSPVLYFDQPDAVAGILVEGEQDYEYDSQRQCLRPIIYQSDSICPSGERCSEKATKTAVIAQYVP